jgi:tRNA pseudouridine38-40 synthase
MAEGLRNIKLVMAYDGTRFHGWQRQSRDQTIQGLVEEKLERMLGEAVTLHASGRTDAGVHALNQVCHFKTRSAIRPHEICRGLNSMLPDDLFVKRAEYTTAEFHARYSAVGKTYEYRLLNRDEPDVFLRNYVWHVRTPLDLEGMAEGLVLLEGRHDFSAFQSSGSRTQDPVRTLKRAALEGPENGLVRIRFEADGFLRHMVRNMVGTLVDVGLGKTGAEGVKGILESRDRRWAGIKAPARGLFLVEVEYP